MTSLKFSVVLIFAISIVSTAPPPERKCRTVWTDLNKLELRQIGVCTKELGWKGGREKTQKSTCTMKCVLTKEGLIQEDGHLSITNYNSYLLDHFPPSLVERSNETFFPCFELFEGKIGGNWWRFTNHSINKFVHCSVTFKPPCGSNICVILIYAIGTNIGVDPDCKEYEPFTKCLTKRFADLCKGLP